MAKRRTKRTAKRKKKVDRSRLKHLLSAVGVFAFLYVG